jgi:hypothetical protein
MQTLTRTSPHLCAFIGTNYRPSQAPASPKFPHELSRASVVQSYCKKIRGIGKDATC